MQPPSPDANRPESPEERLQRRRLRRWKRRFRMAGPFVGVALVMGTLSLSVDLIEYAPQKDQEKERLSDRPMPAAVLERQRARSEPTGPSVSGPSLIETAPMVGDALPVPTTDAALLDLGLAPGAGSPNVAPRVRRSEPLPPLPPYALRGSR